ncbi:unnamed protein product [Ilex paraguariensis]|uniref:BHLH domain-containing protein n=1 Tax=Ilex paraguariensis TaxID=185542 RepID=A0ABC8RIN9_9AQUA
MAIVVCTIGEVMIERRKSESININSLVILKMYVDSTCFDPNTLQEGLAEDGFSQTHVPNCTPFSMEELCYPHNHPQEDASAAIGAAPEIELQQQLSMEVEHCYTTTTTTNHSDTHLMQELEFDQPNWNTSVHDVQDMSFNYYPHQQDPNNFQQVEIQNGPYQGLNSSSLPETPYPPTPDLLNLFHLSRCSSSSLLPNASISLSSANFPSSLSFLGDLNTAEGGAASNVFYDPLLPLNLPPQPPMFRELLQSLPHGFNFTDSRIGSLFNGVVDEREASGGVYQDGDGRHFDSGVLQFSRDMKGRDGKDTKHFVTERQRRENLNDKYKALRNLVPNPTKVFTCNLSLSRCA